MKINKISLVFFIFILLVVPIGALEISSSKNIFDQGETLIVTLMGNILEPIAKEDIGFFLGNEQKPLDYDILRIDDTYFIYAILPYNQAQYTLRINDVYFKENNQFIFQELNFDFTISNLTADFYANPGIIVTNENFTIELYNNMNFPITVNYGFEDNSSIINLPAQDITELFVNTDSFLATIFTTLILQSPNTQYSIPIQIIKPGTTSEDPDIEIPIIEGSSNILFSISKLDEILNRGEIYPYPVLLINTGDEPSGQVVLSASDEIRDFIAFPDIEIHDLLPGEEVEFTFLIAPEVVGNFEGKIYADSEASSDSIDLLISVGENIEVISSLRESPSCGDLGGTICARCEGQQVNSLDGLCCIGTCADINGGDEPQGTNTTAVIIVAVLLLLIIGFIGYRMKRTKQRAKRDPLEKRVNKLAGI